MRRGADRPISSPDETGRSEGTGVPVSDVAERRRSSLTRLAGSASVRRQPAPRARLHRRCLSCACRPSSSRPGTRTRASSQAVAQRVAQRRPALRRRLGEQAAALPLPLRRDHRALRRRRPAAAHRRGRRRRLARELALFAVARPLHAATAGVAGRRGAAGVLLAVPFWEGNLALTETFAILPTTLGVLCVLHALGRERRRRPRAARLAAARCAGRALRRRRS